MKKIISICLTIMFIVMMIPCNNIQASTTTKKVSDYVADAHNETFKLSYTKITLRYPKILSNSSDAKSINKEISNQYSKMIDFNRNYVKQYKDSGHQVDYTAYLNNNILSIVIKYNFVPGVPVEDIKVYNFNIVSEKSISQDELKEHFNIDNDKFNSFLKKSIYNSLDYNKCEEGSYLYNQLLACYNDSVTNENLKKQLVYVGKDNELRCILKYYSIACSNFSFDDVAVDENCIVNIPSFEEYKTEKIINEQWDEVRTFSNSSRYRNVVEQCKNNKSIFNMENLTKSYLTLINIDDWKTISEQLQEEYYYRLIISDILLKQRTSSDFNKEVYDKTMSFANDIESYLKDNVKNSLEKGLKTKISPQLKKSLKKGLANYEFLSDELDIIDFVADETVVMGDFIDRIATCISIKQLSSETVTVLSNALTYTSNQNLKNAISSFIKAYKNKLSSSLKDIAFKTNCEAMVVFTQKVIETVLDGVIPGKIIAKCIYSGGKMLSTFLSNAESTSTLYLQMCATYEFEDTIKASVDLQKSNYMAFNCLENSKLFNTGFELLLDTAYYGNELLIDYTNSISTSLCGVLAKELGVSKIEQKISEFNTFKNDYILKNQGKINRIYNLYLRDYPDLFDNTLENYITNSKFNLVCFYGYQYGISAISNENNIANGAELNVRKLDKNEISRVNGLIDKRKQIATYDLSLTKDNVKVQINDNGYIIVRIPVPNGVKVDCPVVQRVKENGEIVTYKAKVVDGMIEFVTDHFSIYTVINDLKIGDANGDQKIDITDATTIQKSISKQKTLDKSHRKIANVDNDNTLSIKDTTLIQKYLAKKISSFKQNDNTCTRYPKSISIQSCKSVIVGEDETLNTEYSPKNCINQEITWTSSNSSIVSVNDGVIHPIKIGNATITATSANGLTTNCLITVKQKETEVYPEKIVLSNSSVKLSEGDTVKINSTVYPENSVDKSISWSSSDNNIVKVDSNGNIFGVNVGQATITAKTRNGIEAKCTITVIKKYIEIYSESDLISKIKENLDGSFRLMNDISVSSPSIGTETNPFAGEFDGNSHTITFDFDHSYSTYVSIYNGIFAYTDHAYIHDISIEGKLICTLTLKSSQITNACSSISANSKFTTYENCINRAEISSSVNKNGNNSTSGYSYSGGIIAWSQSDKLSNCKNYGSINANGDLDTRVDAIASGIVGSSNGTSFSSCNNDGKINSKAVTHSNKYWAIAYSGGIIGNNNSGYVTSCNNYAEITAICEPTTETNYDSYAVSGGIIGNNGSSVNYNNCYSTDKIYALTNYMATAYIGTLYGR